MLFNSDLTVAAQLSIDGKRFKIVSGKHVPYTDAADILATIASTRRHVGQIFTTVDGDFHFVGGITDGDLIKKSGAIVTDGKTISGSGTSEDPLVAGSTTNRIISGCQVSIVSGLELNVSAGSYAIGGTVYNIASTNITLNTADTTHGRLDVIALDASGVIKITGTPAVNPQKPTVNFATEIDVTTVLVEVNATSLAGTNLYISGDVTGFLSGGIINTSLKVLNPSPAGTYTNANVTIDENGRVTAATNGAAFEVKGEYANNTAAIAGGLSEGDIYSIPIASDNSLLAVVKTPPPVPIALRLKMLSVEDVAQLPFSDAASFETWAKLGYTASANPGVSVTNYQVSSDTVTVYADGFDTIDLADMFININSDFPPLIKEITSNTVTDFGNPSGYSDMMPGVTLLDLSAVTSFSPYFNNWYIPDSDLWGITIKVPSALSGNADILIAQDYNATVIFY